MKSKVLFFVVCIFLFMGIQRSSAVTISITSALGDTICNGVTDSFTATVSGSTSYYHWYVNGRTFAGATSSVFTPRRIGNGDTVYCVLTNAAGDTTLATSNMIIMTVLFPPRPTPIYGPTSVCVGDTIRLFDSSVGGVWGSTNTSAATVSSTGLVTAIAPAPPRGAGALAITYKLTGTCGSDSSVFRLRVDVPAGPISGPTIICKDSIAVFRDTAVGRWSTADSTIAAFVFRGGVLQGLEVGKTMVRFTATNACGTYNDSISISVINCDSPAVTAVTNVSIAQAICNLTPNPSKGSFSINIPDQTTIANYQLINTLGHVVLYGSIAANSNKHQVNTELPNGLYQVRLITESGIHYGRVQILK